MKIKTYRPVRWIGPYQIANAIFFWKDKNDENDMTAHKFGKWLANTKYGNQSFISKICESVHEYRSRRREKQCTVRIEDFDLWSADQTLAMIIVPVLKGILNGKHSAPSVSDDDVPEKYKSTSAAPVSEHETDDLWFRRWEYVLSEMIWAFEQYLIDWESQYETGEMHYVTEETYPGSQLYKFVEGPNHTFKTDQDKILEHKQRIDNGLRLFAKYYNSLWS